MKVSTKILFELKRDFKGFKAFKSQKLYEFYKRYKIPTIFQVFKKKNWTFNIVCVWTKILGIFLWQRPAIFYSNNTFFTGQQFSKVFPF